MKQAIKQSILLFAASFVFIPSFSSQEVLPVSIEPTIKSLPNTFSASWKQERVISGSVTYQTLSEAEIQARHANKVVNIPKPSDEQLESWFNQYASQFNISADTLKKIAWCESHFNSGSNNGIYGGMFQYSSSTWISTRNAMGIDPNPDLRFNAEESIKTSAFKIAAGGIGAWPTCSK